MIQKFLARKSGTEALASSRGLAFGGAGACLAIILLIAQIGITKTAVSWSLGFAAVAFPLWLSLALTYDMWLSLQLNFNDLHTFKWLPTLQAWWLYLTGIMTFLSIAFLLYSLHTGIGIAFICAAMLGLALVIVTLFTAAYRILYHMGRTNEEGS